MAKASFTLPNGTSIVIEGTPEEVQGLLAYYTNVSNPVAPSPSKQHKPKTEEIPPIESKAKPDKRDIEKIVEIIKTYPEAEAIEERILDKTSEANRVLLPLYIIHEHLDGMFGLSTNEISEITISLGVKVSRQNALRSVKFTAPGYVIKFGNPPRYKINRRGISHIKSVLAGTETRESEQHSPKKKAKANQKATKGSKGKGPQTFILELKNSGFFSEQRSISDVQKKLEEMGHIYSQAFLSTPLIRLVRSKKLKRVKENDSWNYTD
jgi:hypothetical protein